MGLSYYLFVTKPLNDRPYRFTGKPLVETKRLLLQLLMYVRVIDMAHESALSALQSEMKDIEDALQYYAALQHKLDYFITADKNFAKASVQALPIMTPKEFLNILPV